MKHGLFAVSTMDKWTYRACSVVNPGFSHVLLACIASGLDVAMSTDNRCTHVLNDTAPHGEQPQRTSCRGVQRPQQQALLHPFLSLGLLLGFPTLTESFFPPLRTLPGALPNPFPGLTKASCSSCHFQRALMRAAR